MAIIIEEEKKRSGIVGLLGWLSILAIFVAAVYYFFFAPPPAVIVNPPANLKNIISLSASNANPDEILQSPVFQALVQRVPSPSPTAPAGLGRANPFIAP